MLKFLLTVIFGGLMVGGVYAIVVSNDISSATIGLTPETIKWLGLVGAGMSFFVLASYNLPPHIARPGEEVVGFELTLFLLALIATACAYISVIAWLQPRWLVEIGIGSNLIGMLRLMWAFSGLIVGALIIVQTNSARSGR